MKLINYKDVNELKKLKNEDLTELADDLRQAIIKECEEFEGHLGSNLSVVELTISLLRHFGYKKARYLFDTSYQAYSFKRLTDRFDFFEKVHSPDGYSIFQEIDEKDPYSGGHTSVSAAWAAGYNYINDEKVTIEIIGDGSLATSVGLGGMLNFAFSKNKGLFILNDNKQAIGLNQFNYLNWEHIARGMNYTFFEVDGHNYDDMEKVWSAYDKASGPVFVKVNTIKALGYNKPFNKDQSVHYISPNAKPLEAGRMSTSKYIIDFTSNLMKNDPKAMVFCSGMSYVFDIEDIRRKNPNRIMDTGISEEIAIIEAAAAANAGKHSYLLMRATFFQRCYDQIVHDIIRNNSNLTIISIGTSVTNIGDSHHGIYELNMYNAFENVQIFSPYTVGEANAIFDGSKKYVGPKVIRLQDSLLLGGTENNDIYKWNHIKNGSKKVVIAYHDFFENMKNYIENNNLKIDLVEAVSLNPIDSELISKLMNEGYEFYSYEHTFWKNNLASTIRAHHPSISIKDFSFKNIFIGRWGMKEIMERNKMDIASVIKEIMK